METENKPEQTQQPKPENVPVWTKTGSSGDTVKLTMDKGNTPKSSSDKVSDKKK